MRKHRLVAQEEGMGCGLACVASELGITYQHARQLSGRPENSYGAGYSCRNLIRILNEKGRKYTFRKAGKGNEAVLEKPGTIVFVKDGEDDLWGHYILRTSKGWMNPWINWPSINPARAGYEKRLAGKPEWIVYEN